MTKNEMKYKLIEEIVDLQSEYFIEALYLIVVNEDYDYVRNLFNSQEDFEEFIEKGTPNKCSEGENND